MTLMDCSMMASTMSSSSNNSSRSGYNQVRLLTTDATLDHLYDIEDDNNPITTVSQPKTKSTTRPVTATPLTHPPKWFHPRAAHNKRHQFITSSTLGTGMLASATTAAGGRTKRKPLLLYPTEMGIMGEYCGTCSDSIATTTTTTTTTTSTITDDEQEMLIQPVRTDSPDPLRSKFRSRRNCEHPKSTNRFGDNEESYYDDDSSNKEDGATATDRMMTADSSDATIATVRSSFAVQGMCCASEVPSIRKIIKPIRGVIRLQINITTKRVYVQHNHRIVTAQEIAQTLTHEGFPAQLLQTESTSKADGDDTAIGRSTLTPHRVLHGKDKEWLDRLFVSLPGVERVLVNATDSVIHVEHDYRRVSAQTLVQLLQESDPEASILQDAAVVARQQKSLALFSAARSAFVESTIRITNLSVQNYQPLERIIRQNYIRNAVRAIHPHASSQTVKLHHNPEKVNVAQIVTLLQTFGYDASIIDDGAIHRLFLPLQDSLDETSKPGTSNVKQDDWKTGSLPVPVIVSGIFWIVSLCGAVQGWKWLEYTAFLSVVFGLPPVAEKAWRTLLRREFDANGMMVVAALGALILGEFEEAASVSFLFAISEYLEARATERARKALSDICRLRPEHANLVHPETAEVVVINADQVSVGDLISVRTGDKIAADGEVVEGTSYVDESSLTGESAPVRKSPGDLVSGGSINTGSTHLIVRATSKVEDSTVSRLIRLVEEAQAKRSPTEKLIDGFARAYTPIVVSLALLMASIPWFVGGVEVGRLWTMRALIIIVIACPCALTISTPVTYAAGLAATARRGVIVKGGSSLEALGNVDRIVLDKTGTLTQGKFAVTGIKIISPSRSRKEVLELIAVMEGPSSHPLSPALIHAALREGAELPSKSVIKDHTTLKGEGVMALVDGRQTFVGNRHLFERIGMYDKLDTELKALAESWSSAGATVCFVGMEGEGIMGSFCMEDTVRPEAKHVVESLRNAGMHVLMLTGDSDGAARSVAKQVGIPEELVHSQLLPEDKLHFVGSLKCRQPQGSYGFFRRKRHLLFCGDGVNDGPALAAADIGVSMGEGAALAMEMSDITLMDSNLEKVLYIIDMGSKVMQTIQENIVLSLICKMIVVILTFCGKMTLLYAIASDVGVMLIVTMNGMKLLPGLIDDIRVSSPDDYPAIAASLDRGSNNSNVV